mmetsp:Transcript_22052/g.68442  ORF Transcript_22052/g.68442 Transcript_22052/m.68442 type:complete len:298 (-) Transcript_22052:743-1636(-)
MGRVAVRLGGWSDGNGKVGVGVVVDRILLRHEHRLRHEAADPVELLVHLVVRLLQRRHLGHRRHALLRPVVLEVRRLAHPPRDRLQRRQQHEDHREVHDSRDDDERRHDADGHVARLDHVPDHVRLWHQEHQLDRHPRQPHRHAHRRDEVVVAGELPQRHVLPVAPEVVALECGEGCVAVGLVRRAAHEVVRPVGDVPQRLRRAAPLRCGAGAWRDGCDGSNRPAEDRRAVQIAEGVSGEGLRVRRRARRRKERVDAADVQGLDANPEEVGRVAGVSEAVQRGHHEDVRDHFARRGV